MACAATVPEVVVEEVVREWQQPLTAEKIEWVQERLAELKARRPAIFLPLSEYWDA